jgi:hypothetical protein
MELQGARQDLELGHALLTDKLKQSKAENERLLLEIERFKSRLSNATQDYVGALSAAGAATTIHTYKHQ